MMIENMEVQTSLASTQFMTTSLVLEGYGGCYIAENVLQQLEEGDNGMLPILRSRERRSSKQEAKGRAVIEDKTELQKKRLSTQISALLFDADKLEKKLRRRLEGSSSH